MRLVWLLVAFGCSYHPPNSSTGDAGTDGPLPPLEGGGVVDCTAWTFMPAEAPPCSAPPPVDVLDLDGAFTLDSDSGMLVGLVSTQVLPYANIGGIGVVSVSALRVRSGATLRATGSVPLAIFVWGNAEITGTVDVSSSIAGGNGAGANVGCAVANHGAVGVSNAGGGGGGFGADGGDGGDGKAGSGGNGGNARGRPTKLEGGCDGADAGAPGGGTIGRKGGGGGALALIAMQRLDITGVVHAGGAGGTGGHQGDNGGGGGGSGGMIKLEASDLAFFASATVAANGGQGGGGCQNNNAGDGANAGPTAAEAKLGNNEGGGTDGGGGGHLARSTGAAAGNAGKGGGGGGGGIGYISFSGHASVVTGSATVSPLGQSF
jgi:hypothetical protein